MPEQKTISARSINTIGYCFDHVSKHISSNKTVLSGGCESLGLFSYYLDSILRLLKKEDDY